jgi:hypothetical protein
MNTSKTNSGGWGETNMREWLNNTVYDSLPDDLKDNIASVKKYYGSDSKSVTSDTVCSNDKLFLLSMREVYNYSGDGQWPWYIYEGTGAGHDEQYQYYECNGVSMSSYYFLDNTGYDYDGNKPSVFWWLRSVHQNSNSVFYPVRGCAGYADPDDNYANYAMGVMPAFAF